MKFKCKCGKQFESEEVYEEVGDLENGPSCEVVGMTVLQCPQCSASLSDAKEMLTYLCIEDGEEFTVDAESMEQAREYAQLWNAEVIRELKEEES